MGSNTRAAPSSVLKGGADWTCGSWAMQPLCSHTQTVQDSLTATKSSKIHNHIPPLPGPLPHYFQQVSVSATGSGFLASGVRQVRAAGVKTEGSLVASWKSSRCPRKPLPHLQMHPIHATRVWSEATGWSLTAAHSGLEVHGSFGIIPPSIYIYPLVCLPACLPACLSVCLASLIWSFGSACSYVAYALQSSAVKWQAGDWPLNCKHCVWHQCTLLVDSPASNPSQVISASHPSQGWDRNLHCESNEPIPYTM